MCLCVIYIFQIEYHSGIRRGVTTFKVIWYYTLYRTFVPIYAYFFVHSQAILNPFSLFGLNTYFYSMWWFFGLIGGFIVLINLNLHYTNLSKKISIWKYQLGTFFGLDKSRAILEI